MQEQKIDAVHYGETANKNRSENVSYHLLLWSPEEPLAFAPSPMVSGGRDINLKLETKHLFKRK